MQTWNLHIIKIIHCLFVCLFVCVIADNNKPILLLTIILLSGEKCIWSLWFLFITESFSLDTFGKVTSLTTPI